LQQSNYKRNISIYYHFQSKIWWLLNLFNQSIFGAGT